MFPDKVTFALIGAAKTAGIEPAALCALVEVETGGKLFEADGRTPQFLYERHVAYREAGKISNALQSAFARAGLAIPHWDRATQYRDERTSAQRLDLIRRAMSIDPEIACRSASWGLGQTMGFLCRDLGFSNAREMVAHQTGSIDGQIDCMIREIKHSHLIEPLNSHDWKHVARIYNGAGYAANKYDSRLADAHKRWTRRLETVTPGGQPREPPPEQSLSADEITAVQGQLKDLGYVEVGTPDGRWGTRTTGALSAFQAHEGLSVSGHYDPPTRDALMSAEPRPAAPERAMAEVADLKDAGSRTVVNAEHVSLVGRVMKWAGVGGAGMAGADNAGLLDQVKGHVDQVSTLRDLWGSLADVGGWALAHWWLFAAVAGVVLTLKAGKIIAARLDDHRTGVHAGV